MQQTLTSPEGDLRLDLHESAATNGNVGGNGLGTGRAGIAERTRRTGDTGTGESTTGAGRSVRGGDVQGFDDPTARSGRDGDAGRWNGRMTHLGRAANTGDAGTGVGSVGAGRVARPAGSGGVDVSVLAEVDLRGLADLELDGRVRELNRVVNRAKGLIAEALAEQARRKHKGAILSDLQDGVGMSPRKARKTLKQAEQLEDLPDTRDALVNNLINSEHAEILGNAAKSGPLDEPKMLKAAQTQPPDKFRRTLREHQRELDRDDGAAELARQRKARCASLTECEDGMWRLHALFDHVTAAGIRRSLARSGAVWDNRVGHAAIGERHRRADVLADILTGPKPTASNPNPASGSSSGSRTRTGGSVTRGLNNESTGSGTADTSTPGTGGSGGNGFGSGTSGIHRADRGTPSTGSAEGSDRSTHNSCDCGLADPEVGKARRGRNTGAAARPAIVIVADYDLIDAKLGNPRLSDGTPLPADEFHRLARDADILPALFSTATGEPMWLGRRRHPSPALRAALEARDQGCIGCGTSPEWCISHHITPWKDNGPTRPDNLTLVCHDCHHKIHHQNWQVHKPPDQPHQLHPPPKHPPPKPAERHQPPRGSPTPSA